ncbi:MAG: Ger(x)C family spore germination protein [Tumebacillaceae bacterium]
MKRIGLLIIAAMWLLFLPGCYDQMMLEDESIVLMLGIDLDEHKDLIVYMQSPVFYKEAKEKSENVKVKAVSIRDSRNRSDAILTGLTSGGKIQTVLISKRVAEQRKDWFHLFDLYFRDPKLSLTSRMILVDGPLDEIFYFRPKDKPRLSIHIRKLIDTANKRDVTVSTSLMELRRQMKDKGVTPAFTEIKKGKDDIAVIGTGLFDKQGIYATTLSLEESSLLLLLQNKTHDLTLTVPVTIPPNQADSNKHIMTMSVKQSKAKVTINQAQQAFRYDVQVNIIGTITSIDALASIKAYRDSIKSQIESDLQKRFTALIQKCQDHEIDPFGYGLYARAYQYPAWKSVQAQWGKAFAKAHVTITPQVDIKSYGVIE